MEISKKKAAKIAALINEYLVVEAAQQQLDKAAIASPIFTATAADVLKNPIKGKDNNLYKSIKTAKINHSARNCIFSLVEDSIVAYTDFYKDFLSKLSSLNNSDLAPSQHNLDKLVMEEFAAYEKRVAKQFNVDLVDIFNLGRQHQETVKRNPMGAVLKKYANFGENENSACEKVISDAKTVILDLNTVLSGNIFDVIRQKAHTKQALIATLDRLFSENSRQIEQNLFQTAWKAYSIGNFHQIVADKTDWVLWNSGHLSDDCHKCRAFATGNMVLALPDGSQVPHIRHLDTVAYFVPALARYMMQNSPEIFTHMGCRCQFVPYK